MKLYDRETEEIFIGTCLLYPNFIPELLYKAGTESLTDNTYRAILESALYQNEKNGKCNIVELKKDVDLSINELISIQDKAGSISEGIAAAKHLRELYQKRKVKKVLEEGQRKIKEGGDPAHYVFDEVGQILQNTTESGCSIGEAIQRAKEQQEKLKENPPIKTGIHTLDNATHGFIPGIPWVVGGFTSSGKTSFVWEIIHRIMEREEDSKVCMYSLELSAAQNANNYASRKSCLPALRFLDHDVEHDLRRETGWEKAESAEGRLWIVDNLHHIDDIEIDIRRRRECSGVDIFVVDYIQNLSCPGTSVYERMAPLGRRFRNLCKSLNCNIILVSQMTGSASRESNYNVGFKGAGEIKESCAVGIELVRGMEEDLETGKDLPTRDLYVRVCKNTFGHIGTTEMQFNKTYTRILEKGTEEHAEEEI